MTVHKSKSKTQPLFIGVDIATAAVRSRCMSLDGEELAVTSEALCSVRYLPGGHAEQDAWSWWKATKRSLAKLTATLASRTSDVVALSIAATSGTVVLVDSAGRPLMPAFMYNDSRAATEARIAQAADEKRWSELGISIQPSSALAKMGWMASHFTISVGDRFCHVPDFIYWQMSGEPPIADWSHALKSGFDPLRGEWAQAALDALSIDAGWLLDVGRPTDLAGHITKELASELHLPSGLELRLGMTDGCAAQIACAVTEPGNFVSVLGTTLVIKGVSSKVLSDPSGVVYSHRHPDGNWLPGGASNTGGEVFKGLSKKRLLALDAAAGERGPSSVISYPLMREGERFPFFEPSATGFVEGQAADDVDLHRAKLEGLAFCERLGYHALESMGAPIEGDIATAGGGATSSVLSEIRAATLGRSIKVMAGADSSIGACMLAATGSAYGTLSESARAMARTGQVVEPRNDISLATQERFEHFVDALVKREWISTDLANRAREAFD